MDLKMSFNYLIVLCSIALVSKVVVAQSGCTGALISLTPCLNYVSGNSSTPSSSCCTQLAYVVQGQPQCLCTLVTGGGSSAALGITINQTLALALPAACNVQTPPVARCNAANGPTSSAPSPADSPSGNELPEAPSESNSDQPSETGSKQGPGVAGGSSIGTTFSGIWMFILVAASMSWTTFGFWDLVMP